MLDREQIGRTLRTVTREVEAGRLRFFLDVIGEKERAFATNQDIRLKVPPTYLFCLEMMDEPDPLYWLKELGVNLMHILHGLQRFDYERPAYAGDRLTFQASISDIYEKRGGAMQFIVKRTRITNQDSLPVATLSSTVIYRDPALKGMA